MIASSVGASLEISSSVSSLYALRVVLSCCPGGTPTLLVLGPETCLILIDTVVYVLYRTWREEWHSGFEPDRAAAGSTHSDRLLLRSGVGPIRE